MSKKVWVCRDDDGNFVIGALSYRPTKRSYGWVQYDSVGGLVEVCLCSRQFQRTFPGIGKLLKPGEGPIRMRLSLEPCEEE